MRDALASLNKELERDRGVTIASRIGVNTGDVVAGDPAGGQALVTGDAVNVAARLEQAAAPGEILIGETTMRLVHDAVVAAAVEPLDAEGEGRSGRRVPARTTVAPGAAGVARHLDAPMVGRERELDALREAFDRAVPGSLVRPGHDPRNARRREVASDPGVPHGPPGDLDGRARPVPLLRRRHHVLAGRGDAHRRRRCPRGGRAGRDQVEDRRAPPRYRRRHDRLGSARRVPRTGGGHRFTRGDASGRSASCSRPSLRNDRSWPCSTTSTGRSRACST